MKFIHHNVSSYSVCTSVDKCEHQKSSAIVTSTYSEFNTAPTDCPNELSLWLDNDGASAQVTITCVTDATS